MDNVSDLQNPLVLKEVASGLKDNRKQLMKLMNMAMNGEVNRIFVTCKDRLTRFGFNYLETVFKFHGVPIVVVRDTKDKSIEEELTEDMMSLLASFSGKLYGSRGRKSSKNKKLKSKQKSLKR
ncbi:MAG: IS607 family transposase [Micrococcaceae bacterium]